MLFDQNIFGQQQIIFEEFNPAFLQSPAPVYTPGTSLDTMVTVETLQHQIAELQKQLAALQEFSNSETCYDGNEEADRLAEEYAESDKDPLFFEAPSSFLKSIFKKKMILVWQSDWENEDTGRSTFNILPRVSTHPCCWNR
ncbi:hypothetical protein AVEN_17530-1 [Araneus ventricosus]|uniref:Uncharacterized protein n=1 Tax=Araneus ventricosus TaxID=182803 RepID=A0A4Y2HF70_ARAVE|nr:hypothetical protein AVEN_17530-1 [Araneus ventricosus]